MLRPAVYSSIKNLQFIILIIGAGALCLFLLVNPRGIGLSADSITYISAAESYLQSGTFMRIDGKEPATMWPPGLPFILAKLKATGVLSPHGYLYIQTFLFIVFLVLYYQLLSLHKLSKQLIQINLVLAAFSYSHLNVFRMLWSESIYMCLLLSLIILLYQYQKNPRKSLLLLAALAAGIAPLFRFTAITGIALGCICIFLNTLMPIRKRVQQSLSFGVLASAPLAGLFLFNFLKYGHITGHAAAIETNLIKTLQQITDRTGNFFLPGPGILYYLLVIYLLSQIAREKRKLIITKFRIELVFILIYIGFLVFTSTRVYIEAPGLRYLDPLYVLFLAPTGFLLFYINSYFTSRHLRIFITAISTIGIGHSLFQFFEKAKQTYRVGAGFYNNPIWQDSQTLAWAKNNSLNLPIVTNSGEAIYEFLNIRCEVTTDSCETVTHVTKQLGEVIYIWFANEPRPLCGPDKIKTYLDWTLLGEFSDGSILKLKAKNQNN